MSKSKWPANEGWIRLEATLRNKTPLSEAEIKQMVSFGQAAAYEFAVVEQYGAKLKVIYRHKKVEVAA